MEDQSPDFGYLEKTIALMRRVEREQQGNIEAAAHAVLDAVAQELPHHAARREEIEYEVEEDPTE